MSKKRKSWFHTILRWLGLTAEKANEKLDESVDTETKLKRYLKELQDKRDSIINNPKLSQALGLPAMLEKDLSEKRKAFALANYEKTIKYEMQKGNRERAALKLSEKKNAEREIERIKENFIVASKNMKIVQDDLDILENNIRKTKEKLKELKETNRNAELANNMYSLMSELEGITEGLNLEEIEEEVRDKQQESFGRRTEFERRSAGAIADREAENAALYEELETYL